MCCVTRIVRRRPRVDQHPDPANMNGNSSLHDEHDDDDDRPDVGQARHRKSESKSVDQREVSSGSSRKKSMPTSRGNSSDSQTKESQPTEADRKPNLDRKFSRKFSVLRSDSRDHTLEAQELSQPVEPVEAKELTKRDKDDEIEDRQQRQVDSEARDETGSRLDEDTKSSQRTPTGKSLASSSRAQSLHRDSITRIDTTTSKSEVNDEQEVVSEGRGKGGKSKLDESGTSQESTNQSQPDEAGSGERQSSAGRQARPIQRRQSQRFDPDTGAETDVEVRELRQRQAKSQPPVARDHGLRNDLATAADKSSNSPDGQDRGPPSPPGGDPRERKDGASHSGKPPGRRLMKKGTKMNLSHRLDDTESSSGTSVQMGLDRRAISVSPSSINGTMNIRQILETVAETEGPFQEPMLALRVAIDALSGNCWSTKVEGILAVIRLAAHHPQAVLAKQHELIGRITEETKNLRSTVSRSAIFALGDFSARLGRSLEPELDSIVQALLHKTSENSAFIRDDIRRALSVMVEHLTQWRLATSLIHHGANHKNLHVRRMASQFIAQLAQKMGPAKCLVGARDISAQLLPAAAKFAQDSSPQTRYYGRLILANLMQHSSFDRLMRKNLTPSLYRSSLGIIESVKRRGPGEPPSES